MGILTKYNWLTLVHFRCNRLTVSSKLIGNVIIKWYLYFLLVAELFHNICSRIHTWDNITLCLVKVALIVELSCIIKLKSGFLHTHKVIAVTCLIAQWPHKHTGIITVTQHHTLHSVHYGSSPHRVWTRNTLTSYAVRFKVTFVHYVKAVLIAHFIEIRIIRIMWRTNGIDIILFHNIKVLRISFLWHSPAEIRVKIVTVYTPYHKRHTVEINFFTLDFNLFKAYLIGFNTNNFTVNRYGHNKCI